MLCFFARKYEKALDFPAKAIIIKFNLILRETVEAEITAAMLSQRVRVAENRAENKPSNGPLRAQSKAGVSG